MARQSRELPVTLIRPAPSWVPVDLKEVLEYRELLMVMVWRDVKVRYQQTALGAAWAVLQPVLTMAVFWVIFGRVAKVPTGGIPYPLFAFSGLLPWQLFAHALNESSSSLVTNQQLLTKVYFPRLLLPLSAVLGGLVDFAVCFVVLLVMQIYYGIYPSLSFLYLPGGVVLLIAAALGVSLWLSALNVKYRDVRYILPFLTQFWMLATPIAYSSEMLPERFRPYAALNPMTAVVEGFRSALFGSSEVGTHLRLLISLGTISLVLVTGAIYFRKMERTFADVV